MASLLKLSVQDVLGLHVSQHHWSPEYAASTTLLPTTDQCVTTQCLANVRWSIPKSKWCFIVQIRRRRRYATMDRLHPLHLAKFVNTVFLMNEYVNHLPGKSNVPYHK
eukprot:scaffold79362_cov32-Tisochrysis_lutea.AAC.1